MNNQTFGVEIEIGNRSIPEMVDILRAAGFSVYSENEVCDNETLEDCYSTWKVVYDESVFDGCEVVSPILFGNAGLMQVKAVLKAMNRAGARADYDCGLHVHVGANDLSMLELQNVARRYAAFESTIDNFVSPYRRQNKNRFCKGMSKVVEQMNKIAYSNSHDMIKDIPGRFFKLNLYSWLKHGTVEFRGLEGTTSWTKVCNWIEFCTSFVEASRLEPAVVQAHMAKIIEFKASYPAVTGTWDAGIPAHVVAYLHGVASNG